MKWLKGILILIIIILLSMIFAEQYDKECSDTIYSHFFDLIGVVYTKGFIEFLKNFNWAFLVLLLFMLPTCRNTSENLIKLVGEYCVGYGKAANRHYEPETVQQSVAEQRAFQKEKGKEIADTIAANDEERRNKYKQKKAKLETLEQLICEDIQQQNIDGFTKESKLVVENDPISNIENLYFDCSYRYKGKDRARRYVNTLFLSGYSLIRQERLYRYIRIMNDINKQKNNRRYIIELICLEIEDGQDYQLYEGIEKIFQKSISNGILAIKKYKLENDKAKLLEKNGWILEADFYTDTELCEKNKEQ